MVQWVMGSTPYVTVNPLRYFLLQLVLHSWCNKGCGLYCPVCGEVHVKDILLLIRKE